MVKKNRLNRYQQRQFVKKLNSRLFRFEQDKKRQALIKRINTQKSIEHDAEFRLKELGKFSIPNELRISKDFVLSIIDKRKYNALYSTYFDRLAKETGKQLYTNMSERLGHCYMDWFFEDYRLQRVRDIKHISLCHNRFCSNCQHLLQASNITKFAPVIDDLKTKADICHVVLTVKNCTGEMLSNVIAKMLHSFGHLIRLFNGNIKIKNSEFLSCGYLGAVRCLECTVNAYGMFHPHLHCIFAFRKGLNLSRHITNCFSFDNGVLVRKFSDLELLIQKHWYMLNTGIKLTAMNVNANDQGYSCIIDRCEDMEYMDAFKYAVKLTLDGTDNALLTYEQFKTLYFALYNRRSLQCYGCFYGLKTDDAIAPEIIKLYELIRAKLRQVEDPVQSRETLLNIVKELYTDPHIYISKYAVSSYLNGIQEQGEGTKNTPE